jgi:hypothetical protein
MDLNAHSICDRHRSIHQSSPCRLCVCLCFCIGLGRISSSFELFKRMSGLQIFSRSIPCTELPVQVQAGVSEHRIEQPLLGDQWMIQWAPLGIQGSHPIASLPWGPHLNAQFPLPPLDRSPRSCARRSSSVGPPRGPPASPRSATIAAERVHEQKRRCRDEVGLVPRERIGKEDGIEFHRQNRSLRVIEADAPRRKLTKPLWPRRCLVSFIAMITRSHRSRPVYSPRPSLPVSRTCVGRFADSLRRASRDGRPNRFP